MADDVFDDDFGFSSGGGGNFAWKNRGKGYVHMKGTVEAPLSICKASASVALVGPFKGQPEKVLEHDGDKSQVTCPACKHMLGIEPCGQHA